MATFTQIIDEAREESIRLDIEVCGGKRPRKISKRAQLKSERSFRVEYYGSQVVWEGEQHDGSYQPPAEGFDFDVNERLLYEKEQRFCRAMIACGVLSIEDFENDD